MINEYNGNGSIRLKSIKELLHIQTLLISTALNYSRSHP